MLCPNSTITATKIIELWCEPSLFLIKSLLKKFLTSAGKVLKVKILIKVLKLIIIFIGTKIMHLEMINKTWQTFDVVF